RSRGCPASSRYFLSRQEVTRAPRLVRRIPTSGVSIATSSSEGASTRVPAGISGLVAGVPAAAPPTPAGLGALSPGPGEPGVAAVAEPGVAWVAGADASVGTAGALRAGCGGKSVHQTIRNPTDSTMNRIVRRSISARDRSRRGTAGCIAGAARLRGGDHAGG